MELSSRPAASVALRESAPLRLEAFRARSQNARVHEALSRASTHLLSLQREDGHWCGVLEGDSILESEYLLLLHCLDKGGEPRCRKLEERLRRTQLPEGGWALYPGGTPEVSASVKAYFALKLAGDDPDAPHLARARRTILSLGGLEAVNSFTSILLALTGQASWERCPAVPPEMVLLPTWAPFHIYAMSSWSRAIVVPLTLLWARRPVYRLPPECGISELSLGNRERPARPPRPEASLRAAGWRTFFRHLDGGLKQWERLGGFAPLRQRALEEAERWMLARLENSDGLGAIFPSMVFSVFALDALGYPRAHPVVRQQLHELEQLEVQEGDALRMQPCRSPVWDTALALNALSVAGVAPEDPALHRAARWLLSKEVRAEGDWRKSNASGAVGGWCFEYANEFYPDCDDTTQVVTALSRLHFPDRREAERFDAARRRGVQWLLSMQNPDGGWAAFDRDCTTEALTFVPFADHNAMLDPSCPDITGRVLETLACEGLTQGHRAVQRALHYLRMHQERDGSWYGRWGCNYLYGTWLALWGLRAMGEDLHQPRYRRAVSWLEGRQNEDGGWGESYRSYENPEAKGVGESTAAQTAWALLALEAAGARDSAAVERGLSWLLETQGADGTWHDRWWTGTGFPRVFYLRYDLYDDYFPLLALARWLKERS